MKRILITATFSLICSTGWSVIVVSSQTWAGNPAGFTQTVTFNCQGGNLLTMEAISDNTSNQVVTSTYNNVNLTFSTQTFNASGPTYATIWYLVNPAAGANTLSITWKNTQAGQSTFGAIAFSGVNATTPVDISSCDFDTSVATVLSSTLTTTVANDFLIDVVFNNNTNAITPNGSQTLQWTSPTAGVAGGTAASSTKGPVSIGQNLMKWTIATGFSQPVICAMAIEPAPPGGGSICKMRRLDPMD